MGKLEPISLYGQCQHKVAVGQGAKVYTEPPVASQMNHSGLPKLRLTLPCGPSAGYGLLAILWKATPASTIGTNSNMFQRICEILSMCESQIAPIGPQSDDMWKASLTICPWKCISTEVNPSWDKSHLCVCLLCKVYPTSLSFGISKGNSCTITFPELEEPPFMIMCNTNLFFSPTTGTLNQIFLILLLFAL